MPTTFQADNGEGKPQPQVAEASHRRRADRQASFAESFAQIVAVFMRDRNFRTLTIAELEWLVLPPIMVGQFALAHAPMDRSAAKGGKDRAQPNNAALVPVAVALWARVSPGIDKALSENLDKAIRLQAADWSSGDRLWLLALAGDQRVFPRFLAQLGEKDFQGREVKMRKRTPEGKVVIQTIGRPA